jgi:uncharacterized membrane protein (UPF0127 family)
MKKFMLLLAVAGLLGACSNADAKTEPLSFSTREGKVLASYQVEVAVDDEARARGLMNRKSLAQNHGMLFVFPSVAENAFWMKNTLIPLDMIFINPDGTIRTIHPMAQPNSKKIIKSGGPVKAGLEINGGEARKMGLKAGDIVHHKIFGNQLDKP